MATVIESWNYGMSENGRVFILSGYAFQWTGIRMQKIRVTRKIKEFKVSETALINACSFNLLLMVDTCNGNTLCRTSARSPPYPCSL